MSKYNDEMSKLHFSEEGKKNLMKTVKENRKNESKNESKNTNKLAKFNRLSKVSIITATISLVSVTAFATGILEPVTDVLSPFFGGTPAQTEIIDKMGIPIGASDTDNGVTITVEAIMATKNHATIIYKLSKEDGTPLDLPDGTERVNFEFGVNMYQGTKFNILGGSTGTYYSEMSEDGYLRMIEKISYDSELPNGKNVTAGFTNLSFYDEDYELAEFIEGKWKIKYKFSYDDMTNEIPVNQTFERAGLEFDVKQINISPMSIDVEYTVNSVPDFFTKRQENVELITNEDGTVVEIINNDYTDEHNLYTSGIELIITKTDGTIVDLTVGSGNHLENKETYVEGTRSNIFEEIIPLNEIKSIQVGDIVVDVDLD